jgi:acyl carrier protein
MDDPTPPNPPDAGDNGDLASRVVAVVAASRGIPPQQVRLDATLLELGIDSLDGLDLFFDLEEAFDLKIPDEVARQITSVRDIVDQLGEHLAGRPAEGGA